MSAFETAIKTVRFLSVDAVEKANSGHPGTPMALAGIGVEIFTRHLRYLPEQPGWPNRDRFVLSAGHASMLLYSLLHLAGYPLSLDELKSFRQWGTPRSTTHPAWRRRRARSARASATPWAWRWPAR
jgi:transketolase